MSFLLGAMTWAFDQLVPDVAWEAFHPDPFPEVHTASLAAVRPVAPPEPQEAPETAEGPFVASWANQTACPCDYCNGITPAWTDQR